MKPLPRRLIAALALVLAINAVPAPAQSPVTLTILYDNYLCNQSAIAHWGFSLLVKGLPKTILFDAGALSTTLSSNVNTLGVNLNEVEVAMISHDHSDHTGGISSAFIAGSKTTVYIGSTFSSATEQRITATGAACTRTSTPAILTTNAQTTGEVPGVPYEQGLIISTDSGLVVIFGCSHPGVIEMLTRVKQLLPQNIYMVIGGFHWLNYNSTQVSTLIQSMKDLGVRKCGATHCTGDGAIAQIREAFGANFVEMGVGRVITLSPKTSGARDKSGSELPLHYRLEQNYPNPFNSMTNVEFGLLNACHAKLSVFDLLGREVAVLADEKKPAGKYAETWDATTMASGIYFYTLLAGEFRETRGMVLVR